MRLLRSPLAIASLAAALLSPASAWAVTIGFDALSTDGPFTGPVTDHDASDLCGVRILGDEPQSFWQDRKGASINAIRTSTLIGDADLVVVRFGPKYKQWNAAFDAGYASALGKPFIVLHDPEHDHALKEVDAAANATARTPEQVVEILQYLLS